MHEPLLAKFRDHKALAKKIARSLGRGEVGDAARLEKRGAVKLSLDHIIKERYPTFVDALRDLDDALSLLFLFANLPSTSTVPSKTIALCQRLCLEFQHYLITTNSLRKSFLSIKGIYYQATIQGQDILWLVPYKFVQRVTGDVDFRIMGTFVEFYTTLLGFVNFRLYTSVGLIYPPRFDSKRDEEGAELDAFTLEGKGIEETAQIGAPTNNQPENESNATQELDPETQKKIANLTTSDEEPAADPVSGSPDASEPPPVDAIDTFTAISADADILPQPQPSTTTISTLFAPHTFYISRECPRAPLEFLLRAFGSARIGWDAVLGPGAYTHDETDPTITHQIVDRPPITVPTALDNDDAPPPAPSAGPEEEEKQNGTAEQAVARAVRPGYRIPGRTYVQPQWVWDSVNELRCLRPDLYAPGATLPPHLSPWVKPRKGEYDPRASLAEQEAEGEAVEDEGEEEEEDESAEVENGDVGGGVAVERQDAGVVDDESEEDDGPDDPSHGMTIATASASGSDLDSEDEDEEVAAEEEEEGEGEIETTTANDPDPPSLHTAELYAEASGLPPPLPLPLNPTLKSILKPSSSLPTSDAPTTQPNQKAARAQAAAHHKASAQRKKREREEAGEREEVERRKGMLGNRKRKLFEKMVFANEASGEEARRLRGKRRAVERKGGSGGE